MDPYYERRLTDEVIYLHSLWHQGPPIKPYTPKSVNPNPQARFLQPSNPAQFKKERKRPRARRGGKRRRHRIQNPPPVSDVEWPCEPPAETQPESTCGWPSLKPNPTPISRSPLPEEQARLAANQLQRNALKATQEFFAGNAGSDCDDADDDEEEDELMEEDGCEEFKFFLKVFMEDEEVRGYYEKNCENGEFCCLVCGGVGKKVGKRFKDCVALVQHSIAIAKTKKRRAHRAYGQAICKILGWNINRLPTIVLTLRDNPGSSSAMAGKSQGNADDNGKEDSNVPGDNVDNIETVPQRDANTSEYLPDKTGAVSIAEGGDFLTCENSLTGAVANSCYEVLDKASWNMVEGNAVETISCPEPPKDNGVGSIVNVVQCNEGDVGPDGLKQSNQNQDG